MKSENDITHSGTLICSEELLFNKKKLNTKIKSATETISNDNLRSTIANILSEANVNGRLEIQKQFKKFPFESAKTIASYSFLISLSLILFKTYLYVNICRTITINFTAKKSHANYF